jgi:hypothetical protein
MRLEELHKEASRDGASEIQHPKESIAMRANYLSSKSDHNKGIEDWIVKNIR